jgi:hypothetical protein
MDQFLLRFQDTALSTWLREGDVVPGVAAYYVILAVHALGMAVVVGVWCLLSLRLLGFFGRTPLVVADQAMALCQWGFAVNLVSGLALFLGQPLRDLMTADFDIKMVLVAGGLLGMATVRRWLAHDNIAPTPNDAAARLRSVRARASVLLASFCWLGALVAGRLIGYLQPPPIHFTA